MIRERLVYESIKRGYLWLKNWNGEEARKLEAEWIVEKSMYEAGMIKDISCYETRKKYIKDHTTDFSIPNKYGGKCGSVIYTSEASELYQNTKEGFQYLSWVLQNQAPDGSWKEIITEFFPKEKNWYYSTSFKYWVTATVLINIRWNCLDSYKSIRLALDFLDNKMISISDALEKVKTKYLKEYLAFQELDIWTIAHLARVFYMYDEYDNCELCYKIINILSEDICCDNLDIQQNVANSMLLNQYKLNNTLIHRIVENSLNAQHHTGGWGYQTNMDDVTLSAYIIKLMILYKKDFGNDEE